MNQRTTLEIIAPTVEEAIAQGLAELGLTADAVSVEVLDAGTKGFFGLGKTQVRVRLTVNPPMGAEAMEIQPESAPVSKPKAERVEKKPKPAPSAPPPVPSSPVSREVEAQPENDALLDRTESVVSKM